MDMLIQFQDELLILVTFCLIVGMVFGLFIGISLKMEKTRHE